MLMHKYIMHTGIGKYIHIYWTESRKTVNLNLNGIGIDYLLLLLYSVQ
jgi:hypothetical protein